MARNVKWTPSAWQDLEQIADYIGRDSPFYAASFVRDIRSAAQSLQIFPEAGSIVPEVEQPAIREVFVKKYRLIYRVATDAIYILAIVHGARDFGKLWRSEEQGKTGSDPD